MSQKLYYLVQKWAFNQDGSEARLPEFVATGVVKTSGTSTVVATTFLRKRLEKKYAFCDGLKVRISTSPFEKEGAPHG